MDEHEQVMLCLKLEKNAEDEDAHLVALGSDGACLMHGMLVVLYLLQSWAGAYPPSVVCTDSYFSSVSTLDTLNANGLKHIGLIKNATIKFSAAYHNNHELNERGDARHLVRLDKHSHNDLMVIVWVDRDSHKFISNAEGVEDCT